MDNERLLNPRHLPAGGDVSDLARDAPTLFRKICELQDIETAAARDEEWQRWLVVTSSTLVASTSNERLLTEEGLEQAIDDAMLVPLLHRPSVGEIQLAAQVAKTDGEWREQILIEAAEIRQFFQEGAFKDGLTTALEEIVLRLCGEEALHQFEQEQPAITAGKYPSLVATWDNEGDEVYNKLGEEPETTLCTDEGCEEQPKVHAHPVVGLTCSECGKSFEAYPHMPPMDICGACLEKHHRPVEPELVACPDCGGSGCTQPGAVHGDSSPSKYPEVNCETCKGTGKAFV